MGRALGVAAATSLINSNAGAAEEKPPAPKVEEPKPTPVPEKPADAPSCSICGAHLATRFDAKLKKTVPTCLRCGKDRQANGRPIEPIPVKGG